jgi:hypothetical protein
MKAMTVMRSIYFSILISIGVFVVADTSVLHASGPIAAYAIVENVVMEPNDATPDRIQVWGVFMLESSPQSSSYGSPQRGYLYYKLPSGNDAKAARAVWVDLKKVAGTGMTIGFGSGSTAIATGAGRVRKVTETPANPDAFPIGNPVILMNDFAPIVNQLKGALSPK